MHEFTRDASIGRDTYDYRSKRRPFVVMKHKMDLTIGYVGLQEEREFIFSYLYDCLEIGDLSSLCGDRVVQMTRTYNDIDAVTKLLEEKEKDLELAAKIGQSLLQQNKQLEGRMEMIEEQLTVVGDQNTQFRHDIKLKDELLHIYTNDISQSDSDDEGAWSEKSKMCIQSKYINIDILQKKIKNLEEENLHLRMETCELRTNTTNIEEKEEQLVRDCFKQLGEARGREEILTDELSKKFEENMRQQEEITTLLADLVDLRQKVKKLSVENMEMSQHLQASTDAQLQLTRELLEMREKYEEVYTMLQEAQESMRRSNRSSMTGGIGFGTYLNPLPVFPADSLAAELVDSVEQRLEKDPHFSKKGKREYNKNVMKTVKVVNKRSHNSPGSGYSSDFYSRPVSPSSSVVSLVGSPRSEMYEGDSESVNSSSGSNLQPQTSSIPGSNDLATALRRLKLRRENETAERDYAERHTTNSPNCPSPDSLLSGLSGISGISTVPAGAVGQGFRSYMPEKLQIVKPMEGSMALHHWQRLATPHIASMLDSRPGVVVKGFREIDTKRDSFHLDEIEDDGCIVGSYPSKGFANTCGTFTYTTSRMGRTDNTLMTSRNPAGTRMTFDLLPKDDSVPGVYEPPPGASLGLASVLAGPQVTSGSAVRLKASHTDGRSTRSKRSTIGLNALSTSPNSEKKAELDVDAPSGVHKVSGQIFSRNASPISSISSGIKILDPDTKARLMEKVKSIRAEKAAQQNSLRRCDPAATNALVVAPSMAVSIPRSTTNVGLGQMMMMSSSSTSAPQMTAVSGSGPTSGMAPSMSFGGPSLSCGAPTCLTAPGCATTYLASSGGSGGYPSYGLSGSGNTSGPRMSSGPYMSTGGSGAYMSTGASAPRMSSGPYMSTGGSGAYMSTGTSGPSMLSSAPAPYMSLGAGSTNMSSASFSGGLMSPGSSFPPALGQSHLMASPMSVLAASRPVTSTTTTATGSGTPLLSSSSQPNPPAMGTPGAGLGLGAALGPSGLGQVLDLMDSPKAKSVISKTKTKAVVKKV